MKRVLFPLLAIGLLMASCIEDKGNHLTQIISPSGASFVYADQPSDTLCYQTTEEHTLTASDSWMHVNDDLLSQVKFKDERVWLLTIPVLFAPNTTGKWRSGSVRINAGEYSAGAYFAQAPFLMVSRPARFINGNTLEVIQFGPLADSAFVTVDSIAFTTHGDWTLSKGKWATPAQQGGKAGTHIVRLDLEAYESTEADRRDTLLLTSCGVTDSIPLLQYKRRVKTE